jgi:hypothetical protein
MINPLPLPPSITERGIYDPDGWVHPTEYGWRFFPGSRLVKANVQRMKQYGWKVRKMACGTYRVTP